jgi:hypothetical protein
MLIARKQPREVNFKDEDAVEATTGTGNTLSGSQASTSDACDNVMSTPELLQAIISLLPVRDIFANAQRVSRTWNAVAQAPSIQTRLWLKSSSDEVAEPVGYLATYSLLSSLNFHVPSYIPTYSGSVVDNPTFISKGPGYGSSTLDTPGAAYVYHWVSFAVPRASSDTTRPTWLDTHLTEPRIKIAYLHIQQLRWNLHRRYNGIWASVQDVDGLTFGTVLAVAQKVRDGFSLDLPGREDAYVAVWFATEH